MSKKQKVVSKCFKDGKGNWALYAKPNLPIIVWFIATVFSKIAKTGTAHELLAIVAFGAIFTWAWLELFNGVNYFRRALGLVILLLSLFNQLN